MFCVGVVFGRVDCGEMRGGWKEGRVVFRVVGVNYCVVYVVWNVNGCMVDVFGLIFDLVVVFVVIRSLRSFVGGIVMVDELLEDES